jgi:para-nitrobenzyl esterase
MLSPVRVVVLSVALGLSVSAAAAPVAGPVVRISGGQIEGRRLEGRASGAVFRGIPFAQAPIGELRWREPQPPLPWTGVRDAGESRPPCAQNSSGWNAKEAAASREDCLYLDVWTPEWPSTSRKPVMVWIHGGGNTGGAGASDPLYEGTRLISHGVVLVIIDYRLGVFGFLAHPELTRESPHHASGNYALLDQLAALRWVHENIAALGGDPDNVTIFGQSAGAADASLLMASPLARGLFHKAILESGPGGGLPRLEQLEPSGIRLAERLKAPSTGALAFLRSLSTADLLASGATSASPNVDGWLFTEAPPTAFAAGRQLRLPVIIGSNAIEFSGQSAPAELTRQIQGRYGDLAPKALALYGLAAPGDPLRRDPLYGDANDQWRTDTGFRCPSVLQGLWQSAAGSPTWMYEFDRAIPPNPTVVHSSELSYVFGNLLPTGSQAGRYEEADHRLSAAIQTYWTNFAKTGDPNGAGAPQWPRFDASSRRYLEFGLSGATAVRQQQREAYCRVFIENATRPGPGGTR